MASYPPPTEDLAIFDNIVFSSGDEFLTRNQADKRYLRFPSAQGTENLQDTNVNGLLTLNSDLILSPTTDIQWDRSDFNYLINDKPIPKSITTGTGNVCLGHNALGSITSASGNIAFGRNALSKKTSGGSEIAIGANALQNNTTGSTNISIGINSLQTTISDNLNTCIGTWSGNALNGGGTSNNNTMYGYEAGRYLVTGTSNTLIGISSSGTGPETSFSYSTCLGANTSNGNFSFSTAIGYQSTNTSANQIRLGRATETVSCPGGLTFRLTSDNTAGTYYIPFSKTTAGTEGGLFIDDTTGPLTYNPSTATLSCAYTNLSQGIVNPDTTGNRYVWTDRTTRPTGTGVILIGYRAGNLLSTGDASVMIGTDVGRQATSGNNNVYVGHQIAEGSNASGCTFIGYRSNQTNTSGSNCTALGANTSCATFQNCTAIGQGATCTGNNQIRLGTASETVSCPNIVQSPRYDAPSATTLVDYAKTSTTANITIGEALTSGSILIGPQGSGSPSSNITIMPRGGWTGTMQIGGNSSSARLLCATNLEVNYPIQTSTTTAPTTIRQLGYTTTKTTGWTNITNTVSNINTFTIDGTVIAFGVYQVDLYINFNHGATAATTRISISNTTGTLQAPLKMTYSPASFDNGVFISETVSAYANTTFYIVADNSAVVTSTVITAGTDISTINLTRIA